MWKSFGAFRSVADVYIPSKLAKNGNHFGFVRFKGVTNTEGLESSLKELRISKRRIFIKLALFNKTKNRALGKPNEVAECMATPLRHRGDASYLEALLDPTRQRGTTDNLERRTRATVEEVKADELLWLSTCIVGIVKNTDIPADLPFLLQE